MLLIQSTANGCQECVGIIAHRIDAAATILLDQWLGEHRSSKESKRPIGEELQEMKLMSFII
jgi:hypothetical protein